MSDTVTPLDTPVAGDVFRRSFTKADGRMLYLYGREAHSLPVQTQQDDDIATGGELRFHPLRREWNIYAAHRQNRTFKPSASADPLAPTMAGGPTTEIPFEDFELAIFENKFSGLHPLAPHPPILDGIDSAPATGKCEVIVYTPEAEGSLHTIGQDRRRILIAAWIDRYRAMFAEGCEYVLPFENRGEEVGATLHHPHGQIYGFGKVPLVQQAAIDAFASGYDLAAEIAKAQPDYGLGEAGGLAAFCPRFARFPYEVWIAPTECRAGPWDCNEEELDGLATLLGDVTRRYDALFGRPTPYMFALHSAPRQGGDKYHFTAQFYPLLRGPNRVKYLASVEQHTGVFTVDVMPETAVEALRAV
ncbi:galactose-1-phosphate uridylyltransferase [Pontixanthobacter aestiaquae]|uniref:Galactose-1-phosphate uridylyltransferase n=1 Tax=Pontixanthobacter aestiaquae TaxID=1509367 RepID=A0A844ZET3_9SPHN|nr:galactose-1-phosphate uridylyltransferase [Pontixanthobacter aestiaquae]MDN3644724.1 galactose-1-phosphate uridylyltransferase [Pontixanthobacter aestiaquae]MXO84269.1 galactose-1-phosphate uridylyltransferase [Pontixanthobacter aestiaquae]